LPTAADEVERTRRHPEAVLGGSMTRAFRMLLPRSRWRRDGACVYLAAGRESRHDASIGGTHSSPTVPP